MANAKRVKKVSGTSVKQAGKNLKKFAKTIKKKLTKKTYPISVSVSLDYFIKETQKRNPEIKDQETLVFLAGIELANDLFNNTSMKLADSMLEKLQARHQSSMNRQVVEYVKEAIIDGKFFNQKA